MPGPFSSGLKMKGCFISQIAGCCVMLLSLNCIIIQAQCPTTAYLYPRSITQVIFSPGYPFKSKNTRCSWRLSADPGYQIQLDFDEFNTYSGYFTGMCSIFSSDYLEVYDSNGSFSSKRLGRYCGSNLPASVVSTSTEMFITFSSSGTSSSGVKFKLKYQAVLPQSGVRFTCSPFNQASTNANIRLTASNSFKYIESPLYPYKYPSNIKCTWYITASNSAKRIQLYLSKVNVYNKYYYDPFFCEYGGRRYDILMIRDGSDVYSKVLKAICSPLYSPETVTSSGRSVKITFFSNEDNYFNKSKTAGFKLRYREIGPAKESSRCSPSNSYYPNNNIHLASSSATKYIKSPWYPYQYPRNIQCTWYIRTSSSSKRVQLTLSNVKIYNRHSYCSRYSSNKDMLLITDGSSIYGDLLKLVCASTGGSASILLSTGRDMTIQFKTDSDDYWLTDKAGFNLEFRDEPDSNVGMIVGIVFGVIAALGLLICFICILHKHKKRSPGNVHQVPAATTLPQTTITTTATGQCLPFAPTSQNPFDTQGAPPVLGWLPVPAGSCPPPISSATSQ